MLSQVGDFAHHNTAIDTPKDCYIWFRFYLLIDVITIRKVFKQQQNLYIVTYRPIAMQRLSKNIPAEAYSRNNRTSIAR
jgi:hypothetical protein